MFLTFLSRLDNMAEFHLPGDPSFPDQGVGGWLEAEPKNENLVIPAVEDPNQSSNEENEEEVQEESDIEPEIYDPR